MVLTDKQRADLHLALLEYLETAGDEFAASAAAFRADAGLADAPAGGSGRGLLAKKWTSVVRLQRKVMDLEARLAQAESDAGAGGGGGGGGAARPGGARERSATAVPRGPARAEMTGHRGTITCVALHPVFALAATSSEDGTIKVWDHEAGEFERTLRGHTNAVQHVAFDASGALLASASADLSVKLWDFSDSFECTKTLRGHDHNVSCVAFTPAGDHVVSSSRDASIKVWEVSTGFCVRTLTGHTDWVRKVAVSPDGGTLASCGSDQAVMLWSLASGQALHRLAEHEHVVEAVAFSQPANDGVLAASVGGGAAGPYVASGSRDKTVRVWVVATGQCVAVFRDHDNWVRGLAFHPGGKHLLSAAEDRTIRVFDLEAVRCSRTLENAHAHFVTSVAINAGATVVVSGGVDKAVKVWGTR